MTYLRRNRLGELASWLDSPAGRRWVMIPLFSLVTLVIAAGTAATFWASQH